MRSSLHVLGYGHVVVELLLINDPVCTWKKIILGQIDFSEDSAVRIWEWQIYNLVRTSGLPRDKEVQLFSLGLYKLWELLGDAALPKSQEVRHWWKQILYAGVLEGKNWILWNLSPVQINFTFPWQGKGDSESERGLPSVTWFDLMKWTQDQNSGVWALTITDAHACAVPTAPWGCLSSQGML